MDDDIYHLPIMSIRQPAPITGGTRKQRETRTKEKEDPRNVWTEGHYEDSLSRKT